MSEIEKITDAYIDEVIKSNSSTPNPIKTQGGRLRQLVKLLRDRSEQQLEKLRGAALYGPYPDLLTAISTVTADRYLGLTVGIIVNGGVVEYWWKDGLENEDLVVKNDEAALSHYQLKSEKGIANGYASLDGSAKILASQLPEAVLGSVNYQGNYDASTNTPALPAAAGNKGKYYVVNVAGTQEGLTLSNGDWIISNGAIWEKIDANNEVTSVAGKVGAVTLDKSDVGLGNVDNTTDANKPISTAVQNALVSKANLDGDNYYTGGQDIYGLSLLGEEVHTIINGNSIRLEEGAGGGVNLVSEPGGGNSSNVVFPSTGIPERVAYESLLGDKEDKANKVTSLSSPNNTAYPTTQAVTIGLVTKVNKSGGNVITGTQYIEYSEAEAEAASPGSGLGPGEFPRVIINADGINVSRGAWTSDMEGTKIHSDGISMTESGYGSSLSIGATSVWDESTETDNFGISFHHSYPNTGFALLSTTAGKVYKMPTTDGTLALTSDIAAKANLTTNTFTGNQNIHNGNLVLGIYENAPNDGRLIVLGPDAVSQIAIDGDDGILFSRNAAGYTTTLRQESALPAANTVLLPTTSGTLALQSDLTNKANLLGDNTFIGNQIVNGTVSASLATASNHLVTKAQLDASSSSQTLQSVTDNGFSTTNDIEARSFLGDEVSASTQVNTARLNVNSLDDSEIGVFIATQDLSYSSGALAIQGNNPSGGVISIIRGQTEHDGEAEDFVIYDYRLPTLGASKAGTFAVQEQTVNLMGNQTVAGVKTFTSSPIVPEPTTNMQAATKKYVDDAVASGGGLTLASGTYTPTFVTGNPAVVITLITAHYIRVGNEVSITGSFNIVSNSPGGTGDASLTISLPISVNNFTNSNQAVGTIVLDPEFSGSGFTPATSIVALYGTKTVSVTYVAIEDDVDFKYNYSFKYTVIN